MNQISSVEEEEFDDEYEPVLMICKWCVKSYLVDYDEDDFHEYECPQQEWFWMKGILPEDGTLEQVVEAAEGFAAHLRERLTQGYEVILHDNGHLQIGGRANPDS